MRSTSTRALISAAFSAALSMTPSAKKRCEKLTQPMCRLSRSCGLRPWPMMNSVEPPPMSTTSRRSGEAGSEWATPR
jgi:hypothetical protein